MHLQGANGTGKTTLLKIISGLLRPEQGSCQLGNSDSLLDTKDYFNQITFIGHAIGLNPALTLRENYVAQALVNPNILDEKISSASLMKFADTWVGILSAGQKRRAALLRLELENTLLWVLDEPFVALDAAASMHLVKIIKHHLSNKGLLILSSHQTLPHGLTANFEYDLCATTS